MSSIIVYLGIFFLSFFLSLYIKNLLEKKLLVASVNERSSHTSSVPYGGGIAIIISWLVGLIYLYLINEIETNLFYALLLGIVLGVVGFIDDVYNISSKIRLFIQCLIAILALYILGGFNGLAFGYFEILNPFLTNIFAFLMIIWFINLFNFLDGINGYAGSEMIFLSMAGFIIFGNHLFLILAFSVLGFLYWNFNRAKIFMGDAGSTLLGYNVSIFTLYYANLEMTNLWIWIILFSLFWFDATVTLLRRKLKGENIFKAHKNHAYQRLNQAGWSHFKITNYSIVLNLILFCFAYFISNIFVAFVMTILVLILCMNFVDSKKID